MNGTDHGREKGSGAQRVWLVAQLVAVTALALLIWLGAMRASFRLSEGEYAYIQATLASKAAQQDPREALSWLGRQSANDARVTRSCHSLTHAVGRAAYERYGDVGEALRFQDDMCGAGYIHGVIESYVEDHGDTTESLEALCATYDDIQRANCFHGVGHGIMDYTYNDLPRSQEACDRLAGPHDRLRCVEGVFMENFGSDEATHPSAYVDAQDLFAPCAATREGYQKGACYFYAPIAYLNRNPGDYRGMFARCRGAEERFAGTCVKGTASRMAKENMSRIRVMAPLCLQQGEYADMCAAGMGSYHLTHFGDREKTREFCAGLSEHQAAACLTPLDADLESQ